MYAFAVLVLMGLAVVKLVDFLVDLIGERQGMRSILTFVLAIGSVWVLDLSLFDAWGITTRDHAIGLVMTGFLVAGMTSAWRALFGYLTHDHATLDETLGEHRELRTVA
jgi:hypothetical protein